MPEALQLRNSAAILRAARSAPPALSSGTPSPLSVSLRQSPPLGAVRVVWWVRARLFWLVPARLYPA